MKNQVECYGHLELSLWMHVEVVCTNIQRCARWSLRSTALIGFRWVSKNSWMQGCKDNFRFHKMPSAIRLGPPAILLFQVVLAHLRSICRHYQTTWNLLRLGESLRYLSWVNLKIQIPIFSREIQFWMWQMSISWWMLLKEKGHRLSNQPKPFLRKSLLYVIIFAQTTWWIRLFLQN